MIWATLFLLGAADAEQQQQATEQIVVALDRELRDPQSLTDLTICEIDLSENGWTTWISYRARNGFGGYGRQASLVTNEDGEARINSSLSRMSSLRDVYARKLAEARECKAISNEQIEAIRGTAND
jgi:hypothetical protein